MSFLHRSAQSGENIDSLRNKVMAQVEYVPGLQDPCSGQKIPLRDRPDLLKNESSLELVWIRSCFRDKKMDNLDALVRAIREESATRRDRKKIKSQHVFVALALCARDNESAVRALIADTKKKSVLENVDRRKHYVDLNLIIGFGSSQALHSDNYSLLELEEKYEKALSPLSSLSEVVETLERIGVLKTIPE